MLEERLNYLYILSIENDITKSLSYEEEIKDSMQPKIVGKKVLLRCVKQLINKNVIFMEFVPFLVCQVFLYL
jgi:hypothetical protein